MMLIYHTWITMIDILSSMVVGSSGKSYFIAQRYIYKCLTRKMNLLVVRQTGKSNRDSTFAILVHVIRNWKLGNLFSINQSNLRIKCTNGNEIIFAGLDDTEKIKSTTFESGELTDIWRRRSNRNERRRCAAIKDTYERSVHQRNK